MKQFTLSMALQKQVLAKYFDGSDNLITIFFRDEVLKDVSDYRFRLFQIECAEGVTAITESIESLVDEIQRGLDMAAFSRSDEVLSNVRKHDDRD